MHICVFQLQRSTVQSIFFCEGVQCIELAPKICVGLFSLVCSSINALFFIVAPFFSRICGYSQNLCISKGALHTSCSRYCTAIFLHVHTVQDTNSPYRKNSKLIVYVLFYNQNAGISYFQHTQARQQTWTNLLYEFPFIDLTAENGKFIKNMNGSHITW